MSTARLLRQNSVELKNDFFRTASVEELTPPGGADRWETMPVWRRYMVAALCVLVAFLIRYMLTPVLGESSVSLNHGTGIGLAIVKQGIQRMGGHVGVESRLGAGSRFWIELPTPVALEVTAKENTKSVL